MKPLVIYVDNAHDTITLTKKQFEDYLKQAYDQGYADHIYYYPYQSPTITWTGTPSWTTTTTTLNSNDFSTASTADTFTNSINTTK